MIFIVHGSRAWYTGNNPITTTWPDMTRLEINHQMWNAIVAGNAQMVDTALVAGADADFRHCTDPTREGGRGSHPWSALHEAVSSGHAETVRVLLRHGAEQACDGSHGLAPLHLACLDGRLDLVQMLIENDADASLMAADGENALAMALAIDDPYRAGGGCQDKLDNPSLTLDLVDALVEAGCDPNALNASGESPLWTAVRGQRAEVVERLVELGADPHSQNAFGIGLVAEISYALGRADAMGQMSWRVDECRAERERAIQVARVLHGQGVPLVDANDPSQIEMYYPSQKIHREMEGWWAQWDAEAKQDSRPGTAQGTGRRR